MKQRAIIIEDLGVQELSDDIDALVAQKIAEAEYDIAKDSSDVRLQIRWKRRQINLVKQAAQMIGIPYETYAKEVLYRQAVADIAQGRAIQEA